MATSRLPILITLILCGLPLHAQDLQGAEAILKRLAEQAENPGASKDPMQLLQKQVEAFVAESDKVPPEKAAATWLALLDAFLLLPQSSSYYNDDGSRAFTMDNLIAALPPVTAWDVLAKILDERQATNPSPRNASLALFGTVLKSDPAATTKAAETLAEMVEKDTSLESYYKNRIKEKIREFSGSLPQQAPQPTSPIEAFRHELSEIEKGLRGYGNQQVKASNLTDGVDPETARSLILKAFRLGVRLETSHPAMHRLVADIALTNLDGISTPLWYLVTKVEDIPLYEALVKKYPIVESAPGTDAYGRGSAEKSYLGLLVYAGRKAEANALLEKVTRSSKVDYVFTGPVESGDQRKLAFDFLYEVLSKNPEYPFWRQLNAFIGSPSDEEKVLALQSKVLAEGGIKDTATRNHVEDLQVSTLLESARTDDALRQLEQFTGKARELKEKPEGSNSGALKEAGIELSDEDRETLKQAATRSPNIRLNDLLIRSALVGELLGREDTTRTAMDELTTTLASGGYGPLDSKVVRLFGKHQRFSDLEKLLANHLLHLAASQKGDPYGISHTSATLHQLAWVYDQTHRHEDVIRLLDKAPLWAGKDLAEVGGHYDDLMPIEVIAARALAATGRQADVLRIIREAIRRHPGKDVVYETLLSFNDPGTEALLDQAFASDRFEERPLIWKAKLLSDQGKLDEAEKTIRQAIAIDPSDGEQGKGDRMRAYRVLGGILDKRGDKEQAKFMESIDKAIRTAEEADDWWEAGIHTQAVKLYESALRSFADAYCIQSRLALRYAEMGDMDKAAQYYQRAFELMPDSFGRVESHCFGCEGAFKGALAQGIAERVFTGLAAKPPVKPQVYYLLGYLRESQERLQEAAGFYRKAVDADPDYLNAWNKLIGLGAKGGVKPKEVDHAIFISRGLGGHPSVSNFSNLRLLWKILSEDEKNYQPPATTLYPLAASALAIGGNPELRYYLYDHDRRPLEEFSRHNAIHAATSLIQAVANPN